MISEQDKTSIREIAHKYRVSRVLLFGSSLSSHVESKDIDIAIEGLTDKDYFSFYGELIYALPKPVDVMISQGSQNLWT